MKYIIILLLLILTSCNPGKKMYKIYKTEESKGVISEISYEVIELQSLGTIKGQVMEQSSNEKIIGANVILHNKKEMLGTVADYDGRFQIRNIPDDSYRLIVSLVGYHSYIDTITINSGECKTLTVELIKSPVVLGNN